jgi:hypothetical protein
MGLAVCTLLLLGWFKPRRPEEARQATYHAQLNAGALGAYTLFDKDASSDLRPSLCSEMCTPGVPTNGTNPVMMLVFNKWFALDAEEYMMSTVIMNLQTVKIFACIDHGSCDVLRKFATNTTMSKLGWRAVHVPSGRQTASQRVSVYYATLWLAVWRIAAGG